MRVVKGSPQVESHKCSVRKWWNGEWPEYLDGISIVYWVANKQDFIFLSILNIDYKFERLNSNYLNFTTKLVWLIPLDHFKHLP